MPRFQHICLLALILVAPVVSLADGSLPRSLIRIPESLTSIFVAETATARFHRFVRSENGIVPDGNFYMSIGQEGVGKLHSGDKRTPLGVYFVTERLDTSRMHEKYGVAAFPLDYPNAWDQRAGRNGDGIWVHGMYRGARSPRPERDTDGCIALTNADLTLLAPEFEDNVTPVLVTTNINWVTASENDALRAELEGRVAEWARSKANSDLYTFLSLYDDDFGRWGMDKAEWSSLTLEKASQQSPGKVTLSDLLLLAYPGEAGLYFSRFRQTITEDGREIVSAVRLYWRHDADGALKIIAEDAG